MFARTISPVPFPVPAPQEPILGRIARLCGLARRHRTKAPESSPSALPRLFVRECFMGKKLYVGNLAYSMTDSDLQRLFEAHGSVQSAQVIVDRDTGRSKGFGFVEMS